MQLIAPDPTRMIDLPGVGPYPRPVDIDQSVTGFGRLVSMRIYTFASGTTIEGEAEDDEVYIVLLKGRARFEVSGEHDAEYDLDESGTRMVYLPMGHHYRLKPLAHAEIAYMRAKPKGVKPPKGFAASSVPEIVADPGHADTLGVRLIQIGPDAPLALDPSPSERLIMTTGAANSAQGPMIAGSTLALGEGEDATIRAKEPTLVLIAQA
jgi:hypothetical protein